MSMLKQQKTTLGAAAETNLWSLEEISILEDQQILTLGLKEHRKESSSGSLWTQIADTTWNFKTDNETKMKSKN